MRQVPYSGNSLPDVGTDSPNSQQQIAGDLFQPSGLPNSEKRGAHVSWGAERCSVRNCAWCLEQAMWLASSAQDVPPSAWPLVLDQLRRASQTRDTAVKCVVHGTEPSAF